MNHSERIRHFFGEQAEKPADYHLSKSGYTDYPARKAAPKGSERAPEAAAAGIAGGPKTGFSSYERDGRLGFDHRWLLLIGEKL